MTNLQQLSPILFKYIQRQDKECPHCGSVNTSLVGTKYLLMQLRTCSDCKLFFRWPKDNVEENYRFYNKQYRETGITVDLPSSVELQAMKATSFHDTDKDFRQRISLLKKHSADGTLLDYGASWGYVTYQLQEAGYNVIGFEIDKTRADYGCEYLNLNIISDRAQLNEMKSAFDVVFTSHVLEHLPHLYSIFTDFHTLLRSNGILCIFVPNCTGIEGAEVFARKKAYAFGVKHTFAYTVDFFERNLLAYGFQILEIDVSPYGDKEKKNLSNNGELMVVAKKNS